MKYYYLGLEARTAQNKYHDLEQARRDAMHAAKTNNMPVRIFEMLPSYKSQLVEIAKPDNSFEYPMVKQL